MPPKKAKKGRRATTKKNKRPARVTSKPGGRHPGVGKSINSLQKYIKHSLNRWQTQAASTLEVHKKILLKKNYAPSAMFRDLAAEAIAWYSVVFDSTRYWTSAK